MNREKFIKKCISILEQEEVKKELNSTIKPLIELIIMDIYPYIYISIIFVIISFILHIGIFILLLRRNI